MKKLAVTTLFALACIVAAAGVMHLVTDLSARSANLELATARDHALKEARKSAIVPIDDYGHYVASMVPPAFSATDQARLAVLQTQLERLTYRRDLAGMFFTRGILAALVVAAISWLARKPTPGQAFQPTAGS